MPLGSPPPPPLSVSWTTGLSQALFDAEDQKYAANVHAAATLDPDSLLPDNFRAFLMSREKTANRKQRLQQTFNDALHTSAIIAKVDALSLQPPWNTEAQQFRSSNFHQRQQRLEKIADTQHRTSSHPEALHAIGVQDGVWPSSDLQQTDSLPTVVVPVKPRPPLYTPSKFFVTTAPNDAGDLFSTALSCMFLHLKTKQINQKAWSLDVPNLGHEVLQQICGTSPDCTPADLIKIGDYLTLRVQIWDDKLNLLAGHEFAQHPYRCPLLYVEDSGGYSLIRHMVNRCAHCGQPSVAPHQCAARDVVEWRTVGLLASLRPPTHEAPTSAAPSSSPIKWGNAFAEEVASHDQELQASQFTKDHTLPKAKPRVSPIKLGHKTALPSHFYYTPDEEKAIKQQQKQLDEDLRRKEFQEKLKRLSPTTKRQKKNVMLKKLKRDMKRDASGGVEKTSAALIGFLSNTNGMLTLPDPGATEYDNEMQWLLRHQTNIGQYKHERDKKHAARQFVSVEDLQKEVNVERQVQAQNKAYENMMDEAGSSIHTQKIRKKRDKKQLGR